MLTSLQALLRLATLRWLGIFICALATLLSATGNASAIEPAQTKTRVWGFDSAEHNSTGLFRAASSGKHQGNRLARPEAASDSLLAARGAAPIARQISPYVGKSAAEINKIIGGPQRELLREFFGTGAEGAAQRAANFKVPGGLTRQTLEAYEELAR
ncbi:MAG: hypothetical protein RL033_1992, partial [Pseudomonadota bacterium]